MIKGGECVDADVVGGLRLVERSGRRPRLRGREPPTWRSRAGKLGDIEETTRSQDGLCQCSVCIVFGYDTKKTKLSLVITGERPEMPFNLAQEKRKGATRTQRLIILHGNPDTTPFTLARTAGLSGLVK